MMNKMAGSSPAITSILETIHKIRASSAPVLIQGESGTGKEMVAQMIHEASNRKGRLVVSNCSSLNDNLLESELFGHVKGSFTGAFTDKVGLFEAAENGTLFLDEVGDMSRSMQAKLLRVLQEREITPVGSNQSKKVNFRIIAATNKNIKQMTEDGIYRSDLFFRLNVINIKIPPLRDRPNDILDLINHYSNTARFTKDALKALRSYGWPGNVRELKNELEKLDAFYMHQEIEKDFLSPNILKKALYARAGTLSGVLAEVESDLILNTLRANKYNVTKVSKILGLSRTTVIKRCKLYGIKKPKKVIGWDYSEGTS